jgi:hypothetical protein
MNVITTKKVIIINSSKRRLLSTQSPVESILSYKQINLMPKVQLFLESVSRNSKYTAKVYGTGIVYFSNFLSYKALNHTPETILEPLWKNEINIYELFDGLVAFLVSTKFSIPTIRLHVALTQIFPCRSSTGKEFAQGFSRGRNYGIMLYVFIHMLAHRYIITLILYLCLRNSPSDLLR